MRDYVYAANDWPAWQRALRRDATALYAARASAQQAAVETIEPGQLTVLYNPATPPTGSACATSTRAPCTKR